MWTWAGSWLSRQYAHAFPYAPLFKAIQLQFVPIINIGQYASQPVDPLPSLRYPLLSDHFLSPDQSPFNTTFLCHNMSDRSLPTGFRARFQSAVQEYARQTGIDLANDPLAQQLENCNSFESVVDVFQNLLQDFTAFNGSVSSGLQAFSVSSSLAEFSQVRLRRKALMGVLR